MVVRVGEGPVALRWVARHRDYQAGRQFVDEQVEGPFAALGAPAPVRPATAASCLRHHRPDRATACRWRAAGAAAEPSLVRPRLERMLGYRHELAARATWAHARYRRPARGSAIAVTGRRRADRAGAGPRSSPPAATRSSPSPVARAAPGEIALGLRRPARLDAGGSRARRGGPPRGRERSASAGPSRAQAPDQREPRDRHPVPGETLARSAPGLRGCWSSASGVGVYGNRGDEILTEASSHARGAAPTSSPSWRANGRPPPSPRVRRASGWCLPASASCSRPPAARSGGCSRRSAWASAARSAPGASG